MSIVIRWAADDDPEGNVRHVAEHGLTPGEVDEVLEAHFDEATKSRSSDNFITFGWTSTGKHIAVVFEPVGRDPAEVYPVTAYETEPPRAKKKRKEKGR